MSIEYREEVRSKIRAGVDALVNTVKVTLGPKGRYVALEQDGAAPILTNDGATIAKEIELDDRFEQMGVTLIKEVAARTDSAVGDGTSTAMVLAQSIISEGFKRAASGVNPVEMRKGIQGAVQLSVAAIRKLAWPVSSQTDIAKIAAISARDAAIGAMIAEALYEVGPDGTVSVEESKALDNSLKLMPGMQFERGYLSPEMVTDKDRMLIELDQPSILITDRTISDSQEIIHLLEYAVTQGRPLLIIAEAVQGEALATLLLSKKNGVLDVVAVHPPAYGEGRRARMDDLAVLTGGSFISEEQGRTLRDAGIDTLGSAATARIDKNSTTIIGGAGSEDAVAARAASLRALIDKTEYDFNKKQLQERLAKLTGGVALIGVGGATEAEVRERKLRVEDALAAGKAAMAEGIVFGGGSTYLKVMSAVEAYARTLSGDRRQGVEVILKALEQPARLIAENAAIPAGVAVAELKRCPAGVGLDAVTGKYVDMKEAGILDSAKVVCLALQNASSAAAVLLSTEAGFVDDKKRSVMREQQTGQ
jgi:chaperonin GroEL